MMNRIYNRSPFEQPAPRDGEIMKRCSQVKVNLYRDPDGDVHGEVSINIGFGMFGPEEFDGPDGQDARMKFVRDVLIAFERKGGSQCQGS